MSDLVSYSTSNLSVAILSRTTAYIAYEANYNNQMSCVCLHCAAISTVVFVFHLKDWSRSFAVGELPDTRQFIQKC